MRRKAIDCCRYRALARGYWPNREGLAAGSIGAVKDCRLKVSPYAGRLLTAGGIVRRCEGIGLQQQGSGAAALRLPNLAGEKEWMGLKEHMF